MDHPRALLEQLGYRPKKRLAQHFLMDAGAAARIARQICESPPATEDFRVLEIGAGTGQLTAALLERCKTVAAIEIDPDMIAALHSQPALSGATILQADALTFDYAGYAAGGRWRVAGNLPYNIATPLIMQWVEMPGGPEMIVAMVQKDVADRFAARPGTRAYGSLSVAVQYATSVERLFTLRPSSFYPRPKVSSTVVRLRRLPQRAVNVRDEGWFLQVVRAAFAYRRKTLANSLSLALGLKRNDVAQALEQLGIQTEIRGEEFGLDDFARLADRLRA